MTTPATTRTEKSGLSGKQILETLSSVRTSGNLPFFCRFFQHDNIFYLIVGEVAAITSVMYVVFPGTIPLY